MITSRRSLAAGLVARCGAVAPYQRRRPGHAAGIAVGDRKPNTESRGLRMFGPAPRGTSFKDANPPTP